MATEILIDDLPFLKFMVASAEVGDIMKSG